MYSHIFVAGTFDGLHKGHIVLLSRAFAEGKKVTIGLTTDLFVKKFKIYNGQFSNNKNLRNENSLKIENSKLKIKAYDLRKKELVLWLKKERYIDNATIVSIDDPHEPLASMPDVDALIVTQENRNVGVKINTIRLSRGLPQLALIEVGMVNAVDRVPISSTRIRNGQIDRDGMLIMPEILRKVLRQPLGTLITGKLLPARIGPRMGNTVVTVGDMTTKTFLDAGIVPQVMIIDRLVGRNPYDDAKQALARFESISVSLVSGPGYIAKHAVKTIDTIFQNFPLEKKPQVLIVNGEEDLLVLPVIVYAPIGTWVYYGQPNRGIVEVEVTQQKKAESKKLLGRFI